MTEAGFGQADVRVGSIADIVGRLPWSALPQKADSTRTSRHVRKVPEAEVAIVIRSLCQRPPPMIEGDLGRAPWRS